MAQRVGMYAKHTMVMGWPIAQQDASLKIEKHFGASRALFGIPQGPNPLLLSCAPPHPPPKKVFSSFAPKYNHDVSPCSYIER